MKKHKTKLIVIASLIVIVLIISSFGKRIEIEGYSYKVKKINRVTTVFHSRGADESIKLYRKWGITSNSVVIDGETYTVNEQGGSFGVSSKYTIIYPNGDTVLGYYSGGDFDYATTLDESIENEEYEGKYPPEAVIQMVYDKYYKRSGHPKIFFIALPFFLFGLLHIRFPEWGFELRYGRWIKDAEPTDSYIDRTILQGYLICIISGVVMISSHGF